MKHRPGHLVVNGRYVTAYEPTPEYYRRAYGGYYAQNPVGQTTSTTQEGIRMAAKSKTAEKVEEATEVAAEAAAATKGKAKTPVPAEPTKTKAEKKPREPKVTEPVSDAELAKLQKAKDAETDPKARAVLRRKLRAALRSRGEFVPVSERPKKEKKAKAATPATPATPAKKSKAK